MLLWGTVWLPCRVQSCQSWPFNWSTSCLLAETLIVSWPSISCLLWQRAQAVVQDFNSSDADREASFAIAVTVVTQAASEAQLDERVLEALQVLDR